VAMNASRLGEPLCVACLASDRVLHPRAVE
jgi:hypothetical protein